METRPVRRFGVGLMLLALLAALPLTSGCASGLFTLAYLFNGTNTGPAYSGLKDKRVVVVCQPLVNLQYRDHSVARDIARQIGVLLKENLGKKIHVVDPRKVDAWTDENTWDDYTQVGKALKADVVLGVDLQEFNIHSGQTVYQGKATAAVKVYDCESGDVLYEKNMPQFLFPPSRPIPASDMQEGEFRQRFVKVYAERLARQFYAHDRYADLGFDEQSFE